MKGGNPMRHRAFLVVLCVLSLLAILPGPTFISTPTLASSVTLESEHLSLPTERIALLPFWAFDRVGNVVPLAEETDIARLATLLPRVIAERLVQSGTFEVLDAPMLAARSMMPASGLDELARVEQLLQDGNVDQVITGSLAMIERSVVTSLRRFVLDESGPRIVGAGFVRANSPSDAINQIDTLLSQAFPPDANVVPRPIARIVLVPGVIRLRLGGSVPLQAYAIDDLGRPLPSVPLHFQSDNDTHVAVDANGIVTGLRPGTAQVTVQPLGRPLSSGVSPPRVDVSVVGPNLGMRTGLLLTSNEGSKPRVGLRLTPGTEVRATSRPPTQELPTATTNPVNYLTSFFGTLVGNQMLTLALDVAPGSDISVVLDAVQRSVGGYFGTGIGVTVPLAENGPSGINLRLTLGTQLPFAVRQNTTFPVELTVDFLLGGAQSTPTARIGASIGLDLFQ